MPRRNFISDCVSLLMLILQNVCLELDQDSRFRANVNFTKKPSQIVSIRISYFATIL